MRPLAGYLRDNPGVRVGIDRLTDSRSTEAHNQDLSERRAASVRDAMIDMGADRARFAITGHGERDPVGTNATAAGMRQNRRVEVTPLGRRPAEFQGVRASGGGGEQAGAPRLSPIDETMVLNEKRRPRGRRSLDP